MFSRTLLALTLVLGSIGAYAAETEKDAEALIGELQIGYEASRDPQVARSLTSVFLYLEKPLTDGYSIIGTAYHDQEFRSVGVAIAKMFGSLQLAAGIGTSRYSGANYVTPSVSAYFVEDGITAFLYVEKYLKETVDPVFVKGYVTKDFGRWSLGGYGQSGMGIGPYVVYKLTDSVKLTLAVPVAGQPPKHEGGLKYRLGLAASF